MNKYILIGFLSFSIGATTCTKLNSSNSNAPATTKTTTAAAPKPSALALFFNGCCCSDSAVATRTADALMIADIIVGLLVPFGAPAAIAVYTLCQGLAVAGSQEFIRILQNSNALNPDGTLKPELRGHLFAALHCPPITGQTIEEAHNALVAGTSNAPLLSLLPASARANLGTINAALTSQKGQAITSLVELGFTAASSTATSKAPYA